MASVLSNSEIILINPQGEVSVCKILSLLICNGLLSGHNNHRFYENFYENNKNVIDNLRIDGMLIKDLNQGLLLEDLCKIFTDPKNKLNIKLSSKDITRLNDNLLNGFIIDKSITIGMYSGIFFDILSGLSKDKTVLLPVTVGSTGFCIGYKDSTYYFVDTHGCYGDNRNKGIVFISNDLNSFVRIFDTVIKNSEKAYELSGDDRCVTLEFTVFDVDTNISKETKDGFDVIQEIKNQIQKYEKLNSVLKDSIIAFNLSNDNNKNIKINEINKNILENDKQIKLLKDNLVNMTRI